MRHHRQTPAKGASGQAEAGLDDSQDDLRRKRPKKSKHINGCSLCTSLLSHRGLARLNSTTGFRHGTREQCMDSKAEGCEMCAFILLSVSKNHDICWTDDDPIIFRNVGSVPSGTTNSRPQTSGIHKLHGSFASNRQDSVIGIHTFAEKGDPMSSIVHRRPLRRDVTRDSVFTAAKSLIMACMDPDKPHVLCKYSRDTVLPTRVLDVSNPADDESTVRLQVSETEVHQQYLALSYCWGKQPKSTSPTKTVQLRKENTADLISGFRLDSLQQSLQDAVFVTRKLGFCYLWIDALCIIQNCEDDKQREISRMASIYKNAAVCIAASTSKNAAHGFLANKGPAYLPDHKFRISMNEGEIGTVHLSAEAYEPENPLDTRAWALQEFMLSSRLLIFSDYELLWQCKEVSLRGVTGNGLDYVQPLEDLPWAVFDSDGDSYFGNQDFDRLYLWKTVVRQYTDRKLTDPNDRLPAITGITTELQTLWDDVNIYGLWRRWFVSLLAWYKPNSEREKKRHLKRAPSWSWASLDGVIYFEGPLIKEDAQVKLLTVSSAELTGRILTYDEVSKDEKKLDTITEWSDLKDPISELRKMKSADAEAEYLLLGTTKSKQYGEIGIGLVVVNVGGGMYRRIGLAKFLDMSVWAESWPRDVTLEPKRASRR